MLYTGVTCMAFQHLLLTRMNRRRRDEITGHKTSMNLLTTKIFLNVAFYEIMYSLNIYHSENL